MQCRNSSALARANPLPGDGKIAFVEEGHKYTVYGQPIERSTTRILSTFFTEFDPVANTNQWYDKWKANKNHKYYKLIHSTLTAGGDDEAAKAVVRASWEAHGAEAARLGTALHLHCEYDLNGEVRFRSAASAAGRYMDADVSMDTDAILDFCLYLQYCCIRNT